MVVLGAPGLGEQHLHSRGLQHGQYGGGDLAERLVVLGVEVEECHLEIKRDWRLYCWLASSAFSKTTERETMTCIQYKDKTSLSKAI